MPLIETDTHIIFYKRDSWPSNHYPAKFRIKGKLFHTVEHFYFYCGALICGDTLMAEAILKEQDPAKNKRQANVMTRYTDDWTKERKVKIMRVGLMAKYTQNPHLYQLLMNSGDKVFVEGSKDKFWGSGVDIGDTDACVEGKWVGKNTLGKLTGEVRTKLKNKS